MKPPRPKGRGFFTASGETRRSHPPSLYELRRIPARLHLRAEARSFRRRRVNCKTGFIFLEILIAVALIGIVFITLLGLGFTTLQISTTIQKTTQADTLAKEGLEALRSFRDQTTWSTNGIGSADTGSANPYYLVFNNNLWMLVAGTESVGIFSRKIIFDKVSRNENGDIISISRIKDLFTRDNIAFAAACANPPCPDDPDTRKVTVVVTYDSKTYQIITYFTNWQK